ncbi:MAG: hypothetical protein LC107_07685 [Chitinophagales bacterium]|nr:hypothetical protein [Chitinophagales bacterium]
MNRVTLLLMVSFLVSSFTLSAKAKYFDGYILMKNGTKIEGQIKSFQSYDDNIKYRISSDAKDQKVKTKEIDIISFKADDGGEDIVYKHLPKGGMFFGKFKILESGVLAQLFYQDDKIEGYIAYFTEGSFSTGAMKYYTTSGNYELYVRYPDDNYFTWLSEKSSSGPAINGNKTFRKNFEKFAEKKCPAVSKILESKKYKVEDFEELLKAYSANCN